MRVECRAAILLDRKLGEVEVARGIAAFGRERAGSLRGRRTEALAKDDVHDLLIGTIAVFQRYFLGEDLDALDCLGRNVTKLAKAWRYAGR